MRQAFLEKTSLPLSAIKIMKCYGLLKGFSSGRKAANLNGG